jgi:hypothetical protein
MLDNSIQVLAACLHCCNRVSVLAVAAADNIVDSDPVDNRNYHMDSTLFIQVMIVRECINLKRNYSSGEEKKRRNNQIQITAISNNLINLE